MFLIYKAVAAEPLLYSVRFHANNNIKLVESSDEVRNQNEKVSNLKPAHAAREKTYLLIRPPALVLIEPTALL